MKRRDPGRGRRVVLWTIGLFWIGQFLVGWVLDVGAPWLRFPHLFQQAERALNQERMPTVVCMGSSRFGTGLNEEEMTRVLQAKTGDPAAQVFNASIPGGDLLVSEVVLKQLLRDGMRPKFVLLEICPEVVNHRNDWLQLHAVRQFTWRELFSYAGELMRTGHIKYYLKSRLAPIATYRNTLKKWLGEQLEDLESGKEKVQAPRAPRWATVSGTAKAQVVVQASDANDIPWDHLVQQHLAPMEPDLAQRTQAGLHAVQRCLRGYSAGGNSGQALERILRRCRGLGIEPVLIGVPLAQAHRDLYSPEIERAFQDYLQMVCNKYGCRFVDYRATLPDGLFVDNHHVGFPGRMHLSRKLATELLWPLWSQ